MAGTAVAEAAAVTERGRRRRSRPLLRLALFGLSVLAGVLVWNGARLPRSTPAAQPHLTDSIALAEAAARLSRALRIATVNGEDGALALAAFAELHALLAAEFPRLHQQLQRWVVAEASLLYRWPGRSDCPPLLLLAHQDVVPVEAGSEAAWQHPAFAGVVADGAIWGRGAIDDKASLLAIMEVVEHLLSQQFSPVCDVWLAFGHDEETGGHGAAALAAELQRRGVRPYLVLDEGGAITHGVLATVAAPLASIGVAEKGYLTVRLRAQAEGGHASMPPPRTAVGRVAAAVAALEAERPPTRLIAVQRELLRRIAADGDGLQRLLIGNLWLTAPLVERRLSTSAASDATLRTTTAPTMLSAGVRENVLAQQAEATVNFRILPGDSIDSVLEHVRRVIDDPTIELVVDRSWATEPSVPAPWDGPEFALIEHSIRAVSAETDLIVTPYVSNGATDARQYALLTDRLYRLLPVKLTPELLAGMHGNNERLPLPEYARMLRFYLHLLRTWDSAQAGGR